MASVKLLGRVALVIHVLALLGGIGLFISTIFIMSYPSSVMTVLETETVTAISAFACGLSVTIITIASIGLLGNLTESGKILKIFVALVIVMLIIEISAIVAPFGMRRRWEDKFNDQIFSVMDRYGQDEFPFLTQMWDDFQTKWQCCGSYKAHDWSFSAYVQQEFYPVLIPPSCCKSFMSPNGVNANCVRRNDPVLYHEKGCLAVVKDLIWSYMSLVGGLASAIFACQVFVVIVSVLLIKKYSEYDDENYEMRGKEQYQMAPPSSAITNFKPINVKRQQPTTDPNSRYDNVTDGSEDLAPRGFSPSSQDYNGRYMVNDNRPAYYPDNNGRNDDSGGDIDI